ncbi:MAG TPA: AMP-binding protein [Acidimicrobiales bacterium]|nr:AMP-binding protein [Acidimicrobiales bacterium]
MPPTSPTAEPPAWARHLPAGIGPRDVDVVGEGTLPAAWVRGWRAAPARRVVHDVDEEWVSGADLLARSERLARRLVGAGVDRGDRVLLSGSASVAYVTAYVAALRAGFVVVPVNPAYSRRELDVIVDDASPRAAILESTALRAAARERDPSMVVTEMGVDLPDGGAGTVLDAARPDDPALLPYTSGTTGRPKGALLSHANLLASAEAVRLAWRWTAADVLILCLPLFHMHGLGVGLHGTLLTGGAAILQPQFDPEAVLATAAGGDATMFFGVPTMYRRLVAADHPDRLAALRLCVSGSAPLSGDLHAAVAERCGQVVLERYGMTETVMLVSNPYDGERRPGTVGFPLPGVEVHLDAANDEILVRGPNVFAGYFRRPDATAAAFTDDGWFRTGDIGSTDADGYLRIVGRAKELIISGGYNVYPREIEDVLRAHPSVIDAAVVGTPSEEWGETVTAYVEARDPFDPADVVAWAATQLAPYKKPRLVHRVDALPRNKLGKVLRDELRPPESRTA